MLILITWPHVNKVERDKTLIPKPFSEKVKRRIISLLLQYQLLWLDYSRRSAGKRWPSATLRGYSDGPVSPTIIPITPLTIYRYMASMQHGEIPRLERIAMAAPCIPGMPCQLPHRRETRVVARKATRC